MSGRTKPRVARRYTKAVNPLAHLLTHSSKLRPGEIEQVMRPKRAALAATQRGQMTEPHFNELCTALNIGEAIETQGVVRGAKDHLARARAVLESVGHSMDTTSGWVPHALRWDELDALDVLLTIHQYQLQQLQYNEYQAACRLAEARVASWVFRSNVTGHSGLS